MQLDYCIHNHATVSFIRLNQWIYFDQTCIMILKNLTREIILKNFENQLHFGQKSPQRCVFKFIKTNCLNNLDNIYVMSTYHGSYKVEIY